MPSRNEERVSGIIDRLNETYSYNIDFYSAVDFIENLALNCTPMKRFYSGFKFNKAEGIIDLNSLVEITDDNVDGAILTKLDSTETFMRVNVTKFGEPPFLFDRFKYVNFDFRYLDEVK